MDKGRAQMCMLLMQECASTFSQMMTGDFSKIGERKRLLCLEETLSRVQEAVQEGLNETET